MATSEPVVRLLMEAGEDIGDVCTEMRRQLTGITGEEPLRVREAEYLADRYPRPGEMNPTLMDVPFWKEMVRVGSSAYRARAQFGDTEDVCNPVWCFARFGTSFTALPDGRYVQIAGEHEDFYDPDFYIYNDVIVHEQPGEFTIYGYPHEVFPPTDFHSATYVDGWIYILGGLGYQGSRQFGETPLYRLNCTTWAIESIATHGDNPGWIYKHKASYADGRLIVTAGELCQLVDGVEQHVDNNARFQLDLATRQWSRLE
jgi:hypothetical protein